MLTDNLNPRTVCIEVMEDVRYESLELTRLYEKIYNFV
jgi:hypothetical protein